MIIDPNNVPNVARWASFIRHVNDALIDSPGTRVIIRVRWEELSLRFMTKSGYGNSIALNHGDGWDAWVHRVNLVLRHLDALESET